MEDREAQLARYYIEEYFHSKGLTSEQVHQLPIADARQLWVEASQYAAIKLTEVESRAHIVQELHGVTEQV
jgi:hypothetical protein